MRDNAIKTFIRETYKDSSPIPYIITGQVFMFILIHIFELLTFDEITDTDLYSLTYSTLSLPNSWKDFITQPWSLITHPFIYKGIFNILFDCLWLYWIGNIFLNFLNTRQFLVILGGSTFLGALLFISIGSFTDLGSNSALWNTTAYGLAALIGSTALLIPHYEVRLFFFGVVKLKYVTIVYLAFEFIYLAINNRLAALIYLFMVLYGVLFMRQLKQGNDWSKIFKRNPKRHLKVVQNTSNPINFRRLPSDLDNQELIDQILDKISLNGYESLTSREKEILFKASKQDEK